MYIKKANFSPRSRKGSICISNDDEELARKKTPMQDEITGTENTYVHRALAKLGALSADEDALVAYATNVFVPQAEPVSDDFLEKWQPVFQMAEQDGVAAALNRYLVKPELTMHFNAPEALRLELYPSLAGNIPLITTEDTADFEVMVRHIVHKGEEVPHLKSMGASFAYGASNRFILLSNKPYSGVSAKRLGLGLSEEEWRAKSLVIRREHECAHYYTKRFFGSSQNNLHDELLADFCGLYAAFGEYKAAWFMTFLEAGRLRLYVRDLSETAAATIMQLARLAANWMEIWSQSEAFLRMTPQERIGFLCKKDLLSYTK